MRPHVVAVVCALSIFAAGCASHSASRAEKRASEMDARAAALNWLQLLDDGDYEEAFEFEAQDFRMYRTQAQFVRFMQARRTPFTTFCRLNGSVTPLRLITASVASSSVVNRRPHSGQDRRRRIN